MRAAPVLLSRTPGHGRTADEIAAEALDRIARRPDSAHQRAARRSLDLGARTHRSALKWIANRICSGITCIGSPRERCSSCIAAEALERVEELEALSLADTQRAAAEVVESLERAS